MYLYTWFEPPVYAENMLNTCVTEYRFGLYFISQNENCDSSRPLLLNLFSWPLPTLFSSRGFLTYVISVCDPLEYPGRNPGDHITLTRKRLLQLTINQSCPNVWPKLLTLYERIMSETFFYFFQSINMILMLHLQILSSIWKFHWSTFVVDFHIEKIPELCLKSWISPDLITTSVSYDFVFQMRFSCTPGRSWFYFLLTIYINWWQGKSLLCHMSRLKT